MSDELEPKFGIQVWLDGDDDPEVATGQVLLQLHGCLANLRHDGVVIRYTCWPLDTDAKS